MSEFGGYSLKVTNHVFNLDKSYGYKTLHDKQELNDSLISLYKNQVAPMFSCGLCATVLTQVSDVEDEINGIVTFDRQVVKIDTDKFYALYIELKEEFEKTI